jgi:hypothetical protein|tara:strand:- start:683 stop:895 length:213 start_codon:yes stop_codon:yes gene_type:complete
MMKAGQVKAWLDQGPVVLVGRCLVEGESILIEEKDDVVPTTEQGWIIHLLQTNEILSVHEETLHNGEMNV